jgi:hypothetical protein
MNNEVLSLEGEVKMNTFKWLQSKRKGSTIVLVMIVLVILLLAGAGLLNLGLHSRLAAVRDASEISARCAADAGLAKALYEMNQQLEAGSWSDSNLPYAMYEALPGCESTFSYTVTPDANNRYDLQAIGNAGLCQKTVSATLGIKGQFEYAIFTKGPMVLRNGTTVDWYNFDADDKPMKIGTNSTAAGAITAKLGVTINGDVAVGDGGSPDLVINNRAEAAIGGNCYSLMEPHEMPSVTVPDSLLALPSQGAIAGSTTITTSGKYDSINLSGSNGKITIDGAVTLYVVGGISLGNTDQLLVVDAGTNPDASLTLYVGGNIVTNNGSTVNNATMDASKLKIYGLDTCLAIDFKNSGTFYGAIYAPNADIHLYNAVTIHGAVIGKSFSQDVNANFYYDTSLRTASAGDEGVYFAIERWSEQQ